MAMDLPGTTPWQVLTWRESRFWFWRTVLARVRTVRIADDAVIAGRAQVDPDGLRRSLEQMSVLSAAVDPFDAQAAIEKAERIRQMPDSGSYVANEKMKRRRARA